MDTRSRLRCAPAALGLTALLCLAAGPADARVFEHLGGSARGPYNAFPGWARAYTAPLVVNGARTGVEVWSAPEPLAAVLARLREEARRTGGIAAFFPGATQAWGVSAGQGRVDRLLCTAMDSGRQTLVFRFSLPESAFAQARLPPAVLPEEVPLVPGAKPDFIAANEESGTTLAVFTAPGTPADAAAFLGGALGQAGWAPALGAGSGQLGGMGFYLRRRSLCGFTAKMSGFDGSCVVTVLHRRLKTGVFE